MRAVLLRLYYDISKRSRKATSEGKDDSLSQLTHRLHAILPGLECHGCGSQRFFHSIEFMHKSHFNSVGANNLIKHEVVSDSLKTSRMASVSFSFCKQKSSSALLSFNKCGVHEKNEYYHAITFCFMQHHSQIRLEVASPLITILRPNFLKQIWYSFKQCNYFCKGIS